MVWEPRTYRRLVQPIGLDTFEVVDAETDLQIAARGDLRAHGLPARAAAVVRSLRSDLESYIAGHPRFAESFVPVEVEPEAPEIVRAMAAAGQVAGVGPMAAVAGAIAERVARALWESSRDDVVVENGGDVYLVGRTARRVLVTAGDSPLSERTAVELSATELPAAVCTSSGRVGHSVSLGTAHAVTVVATDGALADAVATAAANRVHGVRDIEAALAWAQEVAGVRGVLIIVEDRIGVVGGLRIVPVVERRIPSGRTEDR